MRSLHSATLRSFIDASLAVSLTAALAVTTGCRPHETPVERALTTQTLYLGNGAEPADLDPHVTTAYTDYNILIALLEGLTVIDEATSQPIPGTASHWDVSDDGLTYTFHLRPEARWSNGDPVTAHDFAFSFERILRPAMASEYAYMLYPIKNAEAFNSGALTDFSQVGAHAADDRTLVLNLENPTPHLLALAAHQAWFPVHPPTLRALGEIDRRGTGWTTPGTFIGNGAYVLTEWSANRRIVVERNERYWNHAATSSGVRSVVFFPNDNIAADEAAFRTGQLHLTYDLLPDRIAHYRTTAPETVRVDPLLETWYLRFNTRHPPLDDVRVRRALALAIDRELIAQQLLHGSRLPAPHYTPPATGGYTARARVGYDPDEARRLLAEAGFTAGKGVPRFDLLMNPDGLNTRVLEAIQAMWNRELGVEVNLVTADFRVYLDQMRTGAYQIARARWIGDYNDPNTYLDMFVTDGGNNQTGWSHPDYDAAIASAATASDPATRFDHFQRAEAVLLEDAPITPVFFGTRTYLIHPDVRGWVPSLLGIHRYQHISLERSAALSANPVGD